MNYKIEKKNNPTIPSYGKYAAKAVHLNTLTAKELEKEIQRNCSARVSDVVLVLNELQDVLLQHLKAGDKVELPAIGTLKLEIKSRTIEDPKDFSPSQHIRGFNLHILPKSSNGTPDLYKDVPLEQLN